MIKVPSSEEDKMVPGRLFMAKLWSNRKRFFIIWAIIFITGATSAVLLTPRKATAVLVLERPRDASVTEDNGRYRDTGYYINTYKAYILDSGVAEEALRRLKITGMSPAHVLGSLAAETDKYDDSIHVSCYMRNAALAADIVNSVCDVAAERSEAARAKFVERRLSAQKRRLDRILKKRVELEKRLLQMEAYAKKSSGEFRKKTLLQIEWLRARLQAERKAMIAARVEDEKARWRFSGGVLVHTGRAAVPGYPFVDALVRILVIAFLGIIVAMFPVIYEWLGSAA